MSDYIGLIPAGGKAERIHGLPKMLLPLPDGYLLKRLIDLMDVCNHIVITFSEENYDIVTSRIEKDYPKRYDISVSNPYIPTKTVCEALLNVMTDANVMFGMPDTYFEDEHIFKKLHAALYHGASIAVGVFVPRDNQKTHLGMVEMEAFCVPHQFDELYAIRHVFDKPNDWHYLPVTHAWGVMAWTPKFWKYIRAEDTHLGEALNRAIVDGVVPIAVPMTGQYWDCGTWEEYAQLCGHLLEHQSVKVERK